MTNPTDTRVAARRFPRRGASYLVLCDLNLKEIDGWVMRKEISKIANDPKFHLMTGWLPDLDNNDPKRSLVRDILTKPIDLDRLFRILDGLA
jgi:DNA-binding NtrC family response regulator